MPAVVSHAITVYQQEHSLPFRGLNPPMVPAPLVKSCQESIFLKKFSCLHVSYAKQISPLSTIKTVWTVMVKSRNHRNFSRLALDSQLQSLSQTSCAQMKFKIAVAPPAFACIFFSWLISSHMPAKQRGPVFFILFIVLIRKFLLMVTE